MADTDYETLYTSLFENNRDAIIFFNGTQVVNANNAALEVFGITRSQFTDHHIYEFTRDKESAKKRIADRIKGIPEFYFTEINTPTGVKEIEVSSTPVNIQGITSYSIIRDVTRIRSTERKYKTIIERSADLIFVINEQNILFINPSGVKYLGLMDESEIIDNPTFNHIHPDYRELVKKYMNERRTGSQPPSQYRIKMLRRDGGVLNVELNASFIEWDGLPCSLVIARDIEKQLQYDNKLEELHRLATELINLKDIQSIAECVVEAAHKILGYKRVAFRAVEDDLFRLLFSKPSTDVMELPIEGKGIITRAIRTRKPQIVDDVREDPDYVDSAHRGEAPTISEYAVPVLVKKKVVGLLNIESEKQAAFNIDDTKLITILIDHITAALEKLEYQKQLEALHQYSELISASRTREEVARETMTVVYELLDHNAGAFGYVYKNKVHFREQKKSIIRSLRLDGGGITVRAILTGRSQLVKDTRYDPDFISSRYPEDNITRSELDVPVKIGDKAVAVINLESTEPNRFHTEDQQLVETLALHIASTLKNIDYREKIEHIHHHTLILDEVQDAHTALVTTYEALRDKLGYPIVDIIKVDGNILNDAITGGENKFSLRVNGPGITARAARTGETQLVNDTSLEPDYHVNSHGEAFLSELTVPIYRDDKLVYLLNIEDREKDAFTEEDKHLVEMIGISLGQALSKIQRVDSLEETVETRTRDLINANTRLERLSDMKTRFVSTATHEIRTPLTVMKGYLELSQDSDKLDVVKNYLDVVFRSTERLENLVNDLLDSQRIEEGRLSINRTSFELTKMIASTVEEMRPLVGSKRQRLELTLPDEEIMVKMDEARILQLMINLISNASKYSEENTVIGVDIKRFNKEVQVSVSDMGYGFTEDEKKVLFTPFPDIKRPVQTATSVGLGLSICKGIVELHGGTIWAESEGRNKGSVFRFSLPVNAPMDIHNITDTDMP